MLPNWILQTYFEQWQNGQWWDAVIGPYLDVMGPVFPAAVALGIMGMSYIYSGSMALPAILAILLSPFIIAYLPAEAQTAGILVILAGIALGLARAYLGGGPR